MFMIIWFCNKLSYREINSAMIQRATGCFGLWRMNYKTAMGLGASDVSGVDLLFEIVNV